MESVTHDGRTTAYRRSGERGDGPTVLYVHGSGATHQVWARQYGPDGPSHPAVALDLSGHGESGDLTADAASSTLDAYAADAVAVAEATDAEVLVGNSLGGAVGLHVVLSSNWTPDAMILLGTGPRLPVFEDLQEWLRDDFERAVDFLHGRDRLFHDVAAKTETRSKEAMRAVGQRVTRRDFMACDAFDVRERLGTIEIPVLAVCGEHDQLTPRAFHEELADAIPDGELALVADAAHLAMLERPDQFNDLVADFIETHH